jgi:hypothetical protein
MSLPARLVMRSVTTTHVTMVPLFSSLSPVQGLHAPLFTTIPRTSTLGSSRKRSSDITAVQTFSGQLQLWPRIPAWGFITPRN